MMIRIALTARDCGTLASREAVSVTPHPEGVTQLLLLWREGDREARERLMVLVYDDLRHRAAGYLRRERGAHTLQPTALVHEAFIRLVGQDRVVWQSRAHFLAIAASMMRRVLMDHGRRQKAGKRGGSGTRVTLDDALLPVSPRGLDLMALDEALTALGRFRSPAGSAVRWAVPP